MEASRFLPNIWQRYFVCLHLKTFLSLICGFIALYILIDYSNQSGSFRFHQIKFQWLQLATYYALEIARRLDVLVPFALLIATIWTISHLNTHCELIALLCGGISLKKLLAPFLFTGLFFTVCMYLNFQTAAPLAEKKLRIFDLKNKSEKKRSYLLNGVQHLPISDGSTLIYHSYDAQKDFFKDAYWIKSVDNIVHMKELYTSESVPRATHVDFLQRNAQAQLVPVSYSAEHSFPDMHFSQESLQESMMTPAMFPLSALWSKLPNMHHELSIKEASLLTNFYRRLAVPWLCFFAVMAPMPWCVRFSRNYNPFLIYAAAIFALVAFYLLVDAAVILGSKQVFSPAAAVFMPFGAIAAWSLWRFWKIST